MHLCRILLHVCACLALFALVQAQRSGQSSQFFFPPECQNAVGTCCPQYNGQQCGGPSRGTCGDITRANSICDPGVNAIQQGVNGAWWLTERFTHLCMCTGHYWGADCSQCKFGWTGPTCSTPTPLRVRQAFPLLSQADQRNVINAFVKAKTTNFPGTNIPFFNWIAGLHSFAAGAYSWNHGYQLPNSPPNYAHSQWDQYGDIYWGAGFPSWHRHFLLVLEQSLQLVSGNASFSLPYWDWSKTAMLSNPNLDYTLEAMGGNGQPSNMNDPCLQASSGAYCGCPLSSSSPFNADDDFYQIEANLMSDGTPVRRAFGGTCFGGMSLPTPQQVSNVQAINNYGPSYYNDGWSIALEFNLHGTVHDWVGGSMMMLEWSASDPLFFMHHCYVDLLFEQWIRNNNPSVPGPNVAPQSGAPVGHNLHDCLGPFYPLTDHKPYFAHSWNVGYTYDVLGAPPGTAENKPHLQGVAADVGASAQASVGGKRSEQFGIHKVVMEPLRPLHCFDFYMDFDEADVDCGGADCRPC